MKIIESIDIKNFRGFGETSIKGFGKFNIFVGENSCGKTSILEAIAICYGAEEVQSLIKIQNFRHTVVVPSNLTSLFNNFNFLKPIEITSVFNSEDMKVKINPITNDQVSYSQDDLQHTPLSILEQKTNGLSFDRKYKGNQYLTSFSVQPNGEIKYSEIPQEISQTLFPTLAIFLSSNIEQWGLTFFIDIVRKEKKRDKLIKYLQLFDNRVRDIEVQENTVLIDLEGVVKLININFLGVGFKKYTAILAIMLVSTQWHTHTCFCIDEIENGLHFSGTRKLLESILELSSQFNFQFFFTTHSLEFLDIARQTLEEESRVFKVVSTKEGIKTYPYCQEGEAYFTLDRIDPRGE